MRLCTPSIKWKGKCLISLLIFYLLFDIFLLAASKGQAFLEAVQQH
ncbi:hypothetical protein MALU111345_15055 [Marinicrinis lubricantis]